MTCDFLILNEHRKAIVNMHNNVHTITLRYPSILDNDDDNNWYDTGFLSVYEGDSFIEKIDIHLTHDLVSIFEEELFSMNNENNIKILVSHILFLLWSNYKFLPMEDLEINLFTSEVKSINYNQ